MANIKTNKISLNGYWDFMPDYENLYLDKLPEKLVYEEEKVLVPSSWRGFGQRCDSIEKYDYFPMDVFGYPKKWSKALSGVLHRSFKYKKEDGKRAYLKFDALAQVTTVILNGVTLIEKWNEMFLPLELEVTDVIKEENELYVICSSWEITVIPGGKKVTGLAGSWFNFARGIWQDAMLIERPKTHIADYELITSVRKKEMSIKAYVDGEDGDYTLKAQIKDKDGNLVKEWENNGNKEIEIIKSWEDAIYWDCENPYLYNLALTLIENGNVLHSEEVRFGFREFWAEGPCFYLNGTKVNLRGDSWHFQGAGQQTKEYALNWCKLCKERGANSIRYHAEPHPEYYLDAADEMGILVVDETAIYGSGKSMLAWHPDFIENCRQHIKRFVKRDKNHPSVVIWSLQNEMRWVDGRDEYKKYVPEFMGIFHSCDPQDRLISLDGDNRLIKKEDTEIASYHYNIDGTLEQWDRKVPLTVGEHGGHWYICPQNSSMYIGLKAYQDCEVCSEGIALKEQLYMEHARLQKVTGISSFNFAHYFAVSMPKEDVLYDEWDDVTDFGVHPKYIKKYSLTINNGYLKDYPDYIGNSACKYPEAGMKPVTIIMSEYDHSFYDDKEIIRTLNVFNDTLKEKDVTVKVLVKHKDKEVYKTEFAYKGEPGEYYTKRISFMPPKVEKREKIQFKAVIYHNGEEMFTYDKEYSIYPASLKTSKVTDKKAYYYGNEEDKAKVSKLIPNLIKLNSFNELGTEASLLVVGSNISIPKKDEEESLREYFKNGGNVILFEQFSYAPGEMTIVKKEFLRAHASDYSHPVLKGFNDDDFVYWNKDMFEEGPDPFIRSAFEKPVEGDYKLILESSYGDWNDGGDLWSPLMEYSHNSGTVIGCQLDVMKLFENVPQSAALIRNMIEYLEEKKENKVSTAVLLTDAHKEFLDTIELSYVPYEDGKEYGLLIVSASLADKVSGYKGKIFVLPENENDGETISKLINCKIETPKRPTAELKADYNYKEVRYVSIVDLFGYDKPMMSPRETQNRYIAFESVNCEGAETIIESIEGNIWHDIFIEKLDAELFKRSVVELNKDNAKEPQPYFVKKDNVYICRYTAEKDYEKSIRFYTNVLSNLGCSFKVNKMDYVKDEAKNALEIIMSLPYLAHQDYDRAFEYYSDPEFSLNNLGEGLYGWMKKWERDRLDGYMYLKNTVGKTMFITTFVHQLKTPYDKGEHTARKYILDMDINCKYELYINGELQKDNEITLLPGINRFFILANVGDEEMKFRAVFKNPDGTCADNLLYRVTIDEVEPK